jgi:hypothetical protein
MKRILLLCALLFSFSFNGFSQKKDKKKWDVNNPHQDWKYKTFNLQTDEGTWMNLDVSSTCSAISIPCQLQAEKQQP